MKKPLCIVESSSKCPKIISFLNGTYDCIATGGHICEISNGLKSIDLKNVLNTTFKTKNCSKLRGEINSHDEIILATDNDREGEAIAWHICRIFKLDVKTTKRILFNEITRPAIQRAIKNTTVVNMDMVKSQITRQIVDILVGFKISPLLWKNVSSLNTLSAGRCQTPTLMLLKEKNDQINSEIVEVIYYTYAFFSSKNIKFKLNKTIDKSNIENFYNLSQEFQYTLSLGKETQTVCHPPYPLITSTLQQTMSNVFGYSPKKTMSIAQKLYQKGFITYMRTDSCTYSTNFVSESVEYISTKYGDKYVGNPKTKKVKNSQEAHEAIRPTNLNATIESLTPEENKIYNEIFKITIQSCMSIANQLKLKATINAPHDSCYEKQFIKTTFKGWKILSTDKDDLYDYILNLKKEIKCKKISSILDLKNNKTHYSESQLIKKIEDVGIGRPSTYASLIEKLKERGYADKKTVPGMDIEGIEYIMNENSITKQSIKKCIGEQKNKIVINYLGEEVLKFIDKHFCSIFNYEFTCKLENRLDDIVSNKESPEKLCNFYLDSINKNIPNETKDYEIQPGYIFKTGKYGPYIKHESKNIKVKPGITIDKIISNNLSLEDVVLNESNHIELTDNISIRTGKYGWYIFYKTSQMKKPQFYTLKKYDFDKNHYDKNDLLKWINNTHSIYG